MRDFTDIVSVAVLSGFLGSGKSTLLNALLRNKSMPRTAVVVNELGEIGIDNLLIDRVIEGVSLLSSGCVCCAVRSDLEQTLQDLYLKRVRGVIPNFTRVVIETTGLANPGPILQTLLSRPLREKRYELASVITTVDGVNGGDTLQRYREARQQVAVADRLIVTKSDLAKSGTLAILETQLRRLNPLAPIVAVIKGTAEPETVLGQSFMSGSSEAFASVAEVHSRRQHPPDEPHDHAHGSGDVEDDPHSPGIRADSYVLQPAIEWERMQSALRQLMRDHGEQLLRFKGIVQLQGLEQPVVLHAVHHTLYPPDTLAAWPTSERNTQLVFISENTDRCVFDAFIEQISPA